jgi:hypothetical protein
MLNTPIINQSEILIVVIIFVKPTSKKINNDIKNATKINKQLNLRQISRPKIRPQNAKHKKLNKGNHKTKIYIFKL